MVIKHYRMFHTIYTEHIDETKNPSFDFFALPCLRLSSAVKCVCDGAWVMGRKHTGNDSNVVSKRVHCIAHYHKPQRHFSLNQTKLHLKKRSSGGEKVQESK